MEENKVWTLETARSDYRKSKKIKRKCENCKFSTRSIYTICEIKSKNTSMFTGIEARMCKYYTENR